MFDDNRFFVLGSYLQLYKLGEGRTGLPKPNDKPCLVVSVVGVTKREEPAAYMTRRVLDPGNCPREFTQSRSRQLVEIFHHAALKLALH